MLNPVVEEDTSWRKEALCRGKEDLFFLKSRPKAVNLVAMRICAACMVREECFNFAVKFEPTDGTWAGLTAHTIANLRRNGVRESIKHGTPVKYFIYECRCETCMKLVS